MIPTPTPTGVYTLLLLLNWDEIDTTGITTIHTNSTTPSLRIHPIHPLSIASLSSSLVPFATTLPPFCVFLFLWAIFGFVFC